MPKIRWSSRNAGHVAPSSVSKTMSSQRRRQHPAAEQRVTAGGVRTAPRRGARPSSRSRWNGYVGSDDLPARRRARRRRASRCSRLACTAAPALSSTWLPLVVARPQRGQPGALVLGHDVAAHVEQRGVRADLDEDAGARGRGSSGRRRRSAPAGAGAGASSRRWSGRRPRPCGRSCPTPRRAAARWYAHRGGDLPRRRRGSGSTCGEWAAIGMASRRAPRRPRPAARRAPAPARPPVPDRAMLCGPLTAAIDTRPPCGGDGRARHAPPERTRSPSRRRAAATPSAGRARRPASARRRGSSRRRRRRRRTRRRCGRPRPPGATPHDCHSSASAYSTANSAGWA